jgi:hypothetical protein
MESLQVRKMINKPNPFGLGMLQSQLYPSKQVDDSLSSIQCQPFNGKIDGR